MAENGNSKTENKAGEELLAAACKAYGISKEHVFASNYYPEAGEVVIVTAGGTKVRFKKGDKVEALEPVRVDGVIRKKMKPVTGAKKKK